MNDLIFFLINDLIFFLRLDTAQEMDQTVNGLLDEDEDTRRLFQFRWYIEKKILPRTPSALTKELRYVSFYLLCSMLELIPLALHIAVTQHGAMEESHGTAVPLAQCSRAFLLLPTMWTSPAILRGGNSHFTRPPFSTFQNSGSWLAGVHLNSVHALEFEIWRGVCVCVKAEIWRMWRLFKELLLHYSGIDLV